MAASYLHGSEVIPVQKGVRPVSVVRSAVIGLVGVAPKVTKDTLKLVLSSTDAAAFGAELPGFTIPQALRAIFDQGPTAVLVINAFDAVANTVAVSVEAHVLTAGKIKLTYAPLDAPVIKDNGGSVIGGLVAGVDYKFDEYGNFTNLGTTLVNGTTYKFDYTRFDPASVTNSQIIGAVSGSGIRSGLKVFQEAYVTFGFKPKIIIAPGFATIAAIASAMRVEAAYYKATDIVDAPAGTTVATALAGRGPAGTINYITDSVRDILAYPMVKAFDPYTQADQLRPYSAYLAGVMAQVDNKEGYHVSPSNHAIKGITGIERPITFDPTDASGTTEANTLNAAGIVTIGNTYGTGFLVWGNRSAAFPTNTAPENFVCVQRVRDVVEDSIQFAMMPFADQPITLPQIDSVAETVNTFFRALIARGALVDGVCTFDPSLNTDAELAAGHVTFSLNFMPPTPMERITFTSTIDITMLRALIKAASV